MPARKEILIGFDSAWTDNARAPGAICSLTFTDDASDFAAPRLVRFENAAAFIEQAEGPGDFTLVALDQPTRVPNHEGCRPVERVAGSIVSRLGGGVQPARRGGGGACMFGDGAPVWRFLDRVAATEDPIRSRTADQGRFLVEVFPALALPTIVPEIWRRRRAAKYNPAASRYVPADWPLVCIGAAQFAADAGAASVARWLIEAGSLARPTKSDQDKLDSVICLLVALCWRRGAVAASVVLGDVRYGYMVTPASPEVRTVLHVAAAKCNVPIDEPGAHQRQPIAETPSSQPAIVPLPVPAVPKATPVRAPSSWTAPPGSFRMSEDELRDLLVSIAKAGQLITYGEVAARFGQAWTQGFASSLVRALNQVGAANRQEAEPPLMCLVVNKQTRMPGPGYFAEVGLTGASDAARTTAHIQSREACRTFDWSAYGQNQ